MQEKTKDIISIIIYAIFIILTILTLIFLPMTSKSLAIANYLISSLYLLIYCYIIIYFIINKKKPKSKSFLLIILDLILVSELIAFSLNSEYYGRYKKICPFTLSNVDLKSHFEKRCEFYNKNDNSRYSYQYICSYNAYNDLEDFHPNKNDYETSNELVILRCLEYKNKIDGNYIISEFVKEYNNTNKYYCSLVYRPKVNNYIDSKECIKDRKTINTLATILLFIQIIFIMIVEPIINSKRNGPSPIEVNIQLRRENNNRFDGIIRLFNLERMINLIRGLIYINALENMNDSNVSTEKSERPNENENNFEGEITKNIIVDNNGSFEIDINIKNLYKENQGDKNSISLDQINVGIGSEEISIQNENNSIDNNSEIK